MRRFFTVLFVLSVLATAATYYWRVYLPEKSVVVQAPAASPGAKSARKFSNDDGAEAVSPSLRSSEREFVQEPSQRQDFAMMISIFSSVVSAIAALFQTWLTARSVRSRA
jgi:hypothetical protein